MKMILWQVTFVSLLQQLSISTFWLPGFEWETSDVPQTWDDLSFFSALPSFRTPKIEAEAPLQPQLHIGRQVMIGVYFASFGIARFASQRIVVKVILLFLFPQGGEIPVFQAIALLTDAMQVLNKLIKVINCWPKCP